MRLTVTTGAPDEDPNGDLDLGGWLPPHLDEPVGAFTDEILKRHPLGRAPGVDATKRLRYVE
jgi:hypothetical protein